MYVVKRDGRHEPVAFDKITERLRNLVLNDLTEVDVVLVAQKVVAGVYPGVRTSELDELAAETAASMSTVHPQYHQLAGRIAVTNLHKATNASFSHTMLQTLDSVLNESFVDFVRAHATELDQLPQHERDLYAFDYFGFRTLERSYLLRDPRTRAVVERPQHMWLRVAIAVEFEGDDASRLLRISETYTLMSTGAYTHATPTLFNSGMTKQQLSSCFLLQTQSDSIEGIFDTLKQCACISKYAGGIGLAVHNIRASGSLIHSTQGRSNGLVPMLRVFNETARYVDQGGGKRKGAFAIYIEPWHADIFEVLLMKRNQGNEHERARDLFYALWTPDLFMRRVESGGDWTLFDPGTAPGLQEVHGSAFDALYERYEREGRGVRSVKALLLWRAILSSQQETGTPYMLFKDACNLKSNHQHLGTIQSSNLCTEVLEYTSADEIAVCNLASISLPHFVVDVLSPEQAAWVRVPYDGTFAWRMQLPRHVAELVDWRECEVPVTMECVAHEAIFSPHRTPSTCVASSVQAVHDALAALGLHVHDSVADTQPPNFVRISIAMQTDNVEAREHGSDGVIVELRREAGDAFVFGRVFSVLQRVLNGACVEDLRSSIAHDVVHLRIASPAREEAVRVGDVRRIGADVLRTERSDETSWKSRRSELLQSDVASIYYIDGMAVLLSSRPFPLPLARATFDYAKLHRVAMRVAANLDKVIDANFYPLPQAERSNRRHRPIGIGVQGLADVFARMMVPFESDEAAAINRAIFETIYHAAATSSCNRAVSHGVYESFPGSPSSQGRLQYHLWNLRPTHTLRGGNANVRAAHPFELDWQALEHGVATHGLRNSLLVAPMPTASTAQILGNNESFEPFMSNMYTRRVLAGEFTVVNKHLVNTLVRRGLWTPQLRDRLIATKGSVQRLTELPLDVRAVFKTVWEIPHKVIMNQAIARGPFVCQSQSLNAHMSEVTFEKLTSMHFYAWRNGLKTGMYYLRTRPKADAIAFTVDPALARALQTPAPTHTPTQGTQGTPAEDETECLNCSA